MSKKVNVVVLMGGVSSEYKISLISGREVVRNLDDTKYNILPVVISRDGKEWLSFTPNELLSLPNPLLLKDTKKELVKKDSTGFSGLDQIGREVDIVFIAMHGQYGEDGTVQGMLELAGLKYTGSGVLASALGMDKIMFRKILKSEGIPVPNYLFLRKRDSTSIISQKLGKVPYFVKPHNQGSSVGATIVKTKKDFSKALKTAFKYSKFALVDEYIKGLEVTCSVIGNENPIPLPLIEIRPLKGEFFNYESKYTESGAEEIVPARISESLTKKVQSIAIEVYKAIGCRGFSRVDFILKNNIYPVVLEINTIPGLTPMSLLPKAGKAAGFSYSQLLDEIIKYGIT